MLHITNNSFYTCKPHTREELLKIIIERIKDEGPECDLNDIDVSEIEDMSFLFNANTEYWGNDIFNNFNGDISLWDVSGVTNMRGMFNFCEQFNCDLSRWDVSNVENVEWMFYECRNFNQNLDNWDVSKVKYMDGAFFNCPIKPTWY